MGTFYFAPNSRDTWYTQWTKYLQSESQTRDIAQAIQQSAASYNATIENLESSNRRIADRQIEVAQHYAAEVIGALGDMSELIVEAVERSGEMVAGAVGDLSTMLDWRFSQLIDAQRVANMLSLNIAQLLRIPDFQKERQYFVEQGFKHYANAINDKELFADALSNLKQAEEREKTDYVVLHRIGMIYLYQSRSPEDILKAEEYFRLAAKYATAESSPDAIRLSNLLMGDSSKDLHEHKTPIENIRRIAADALLQAGIACYVQGKFLEASGLSEKAFRMHPELTEARFNQAKFLAAGDQVEFAVTIAREVIEKDRNYAPKVAQDGDLIPKPPISSLLEQLREEAVAKARLQLDACRKEMIPESQAQKVLDEISQLIDRNTYLDALASLDEMSKQRQWIALGEMKWTPSSIRELRSLEGHSSGVNSVAWSPDGKIIASGSTDKTVKLWDAITGKALRTLTGHAYTISCLDFSPDGKVLASASWDKTAKLWDTDSGRALRTLSGHLEMLYAVAFSKDGKIVASASEDHTIKIWDVSTGRELATLNGHSDGVTSLAFHPDGKHLASSSCDTTVKIWRVYTWREVKTLKRHSWDVMSIAFSPDGELLASGGKDEEIYIWDWKAGILKKPIKRISEKEASSLSFHPDGDLLAGRSRDKTVRVWDVRSGRCLATLALDTCTIGLHSKVAYSPDGSVLATGSGRELKIFGVATFATLSEFVLLEQEYIKEQRLKIEREKEQKFHEEKRRLQAKEAQERFEKEQEAAALSQAQARRVEANRLFDEAVAEEKLQRSRWGIFNFMVRDFTKAIDLYRQADALGQFEAQGKIKALESNTEKRQNTRIFMGVVVALVVISTIVFSISTYYNTKADTIANLRDSDYTLFFTYNPLNARHGRWGSVLKTEAVINEKAYEVAMFDMGILQFDFHVPERHDIILARLYWFSFGSASDGVENAHAKLFVNSREVRDGIVPFASSEGIPINSYNITRFVKKQNNKFMINHYRPEVESYKLALQKIEFLYYTYNN